MEVAGARAGARARAGVRAFRMVLSIRCKSSFKYLEILIAAAEMITMGDFVPKSLVGYLENSDLGDEKESGEMTERRSWRKGL